MPQKACERYIFHVMAFKKTNIKKRGISQKKHVINFKKAQKPKMKWGISKKLHKPPREKYIFLMLFGAFHNTSRREAPVQCFTTQQ